MRPEEFQFQKIYRPEEQLNAEEISLKWLGTAGFKLTYKGTTILIDPFFSRFSLTEILFKRLRPKTDIIDACLEKHIDHCDYIVVGHSHYDHLADVPYIAKKLGCQVVGSQSSANLLCAADLPEDQIIVASGGQSILLDDFAIRFVRSRHSAFLFGKIPYPGEIATDLNLPLKVSDYRCGEVFGLSIMADDFHIFHLGSCDLIEENLDVPPADLFLMGISGRDATPHFVARAISTLQPQTVLPHHYDNFFRGFDKKIRILPRMKFGQMVKEAREVDPQLEIVTLKPWQEMRMDSKNR